MEISRKLFFILYKNSYFKYFYDILTLDLSRFILFVYGTITHLASPQRKAQKCQTIRWIFLARTMQCNALRLSSKSRFPIPEENKNVISRMN
jgi:hypothetical protein